MQIHFELGQQVSWESQAGGWRKTKAGTVVEVVAAGALPDRDRFRQLYRSAGVGLPRDEVSYVVRVPGATEKSKGTVYWPRARHLTAVGEKPQAAAE